MKNIFGKFKDESGQALVIIALSLVVILGATALSVDVGMAFVAKSKLQAAADAAALAGAQSLPSVELAKSIAVQYAGSNGVAEGDILPPESPVESNGVSNSNQIKVTLEQNFNYIFARVLGFDSKMIRVSATAERRMVWGGETLPFLNIDNPYDTGQPIVLWNKTNWGDFEQLRNQGNHNEYEFTYAGDGHGSNNTAINCMLNGLLNEDGTLDALDVRNGENVSIDAEVTDLCEQWSPPNVDFIYVLSLEKIPTDPLNYITSNGTKVNGKVQSASISLDDIVLLKCRITSCVLKPVNANNRGIVLEYLGTKINLGEALRDETYIPGFANSDFRISLVD